MKPVSAPCRMFCRWWWMFWCFLSCVTEWQGDARLGLNSATGRHLHTSTAPRLQFDPKKPRKEIAILIVLGWGAAEIGVVYSPQSALACSGYLSSSEDSKAGNLQLTGIVKSHRKKILLSTRYCTSVVDLFWSELVIYLYFSRVF